MDKCAYPAGDMSDKADPVICNAQGTRAGQMGAGRDDHLPGAMWHVTRAAQA